MHAHGQAAPDKRSQVLRVHHIVQGQNQREFTSFASPFQNRMMLHQGKIANLGKNTLVYFISKACFEIVCPFGINRNPSVSSPFQYRLNPFTPSAFRHVQRLKATPSRHQGFVDGVYAVKKATRG